MRSLLCLLALLCLLCNPARAASDLDHAAALRTATEGQRLYQKEDYVGAVDKFRQAYLLYPSPDLQVYVAASLLNLHQEIDAVRALIEFYAGSEEARDDVRALARRLWGETSPEARAGLIGPGGSRLAPALRGRLGRLSLVRRSELPAELRAAALQMQRPRPLWPGFVLGGLGLAAVVSGAALVGIHGTCATPGTITTCDRVYQTSAGGYTAVALGLAGLGAGVVWFTYSAHLWPRHEGRISLAPVPGGLLAVGTF